MSKPKNLAGRQYPKAAYFEISAADFDSNGGVIDFKAPADSEIVVGHINVTQAFDGATSDQVKVGDSTNDARYLALTTVKATGRTALVPTGFIHGDASNSTRTLRVTRATVGAKTSVGKVRIYAAYVKIGRDNGAED